MGKHLTNKDFDFYINQRMTDVDEARRTPRSLSLKTKILTICPVCQFIKVVMISPRSQMITRSHSSPGRSNLIAFFRGMMSGSRIEDGVLTRTNNEQSTIKIYKEM